MANYPQLSEQYPYLDCKQVQAMQKVARAKFESAEDEIEGVDAEFANSPEVKQMQERLQRTRKMKKLLNNCVF